MSTYVVWVRDVYGGEDEYLGPFRSVERAERIARQIRGDIAALGAVGVFDAGVELVRDGSESQDVRNELIEALGAMGYKK